MITTGQLISYTLNAADADMINRRRTTGAAIAERMKQDYQAGPRWPEGAQAHIGNPAAAGQSFPGVIVQIFSPDSADPPCNLQVWLDGCDCYWATSRHECTGAEAAGFFRRL